MDSNNMNQFDNNDTVQYQQTNTYAEPYQQPVQQYQQPYQQPVPQQQLEEPMSVGDWMITYLIMMIPCVNLIMMFVWAFGSSEKKSKSNFFKASLIWTGILVALYIVLFLIVGVSALGIVGSSY